MSVVDVRNNNGTAEGATFLITLQVRNWRARLGVIGLCVEDRIARKQEARTVQLIRARLGDQADHAAGETAILRREHTRLHIELLYGIHNGLISTRTITYVIFRQDVGLAVDLLFVICIA